jgi:hypothetical protein
MTNRRGRGGDSPRVRRVRARNGTGRRLPDGFAERACGRQVPRPSSGGGGPVGATPVPVPSVGPLDPGRALRFPVPSQSFSPIQKIMLSLFRKSCSIADILPHSEGALRAIVTTREAGMRWLRGAAACPWGHSFGCADERLVADAKACGPGAPKLAPSWQGMMILLTTVAIKPDTGESAP